MMQRAIAALLLFGAAAWAENVPESVVESYLAMAEDSPAEPAEKKSLWEIKLGLGLTYTEGNSNNTTFGFNGDAVRTWDPWKLLFSIRSLYAEANSVETDNKHVFIERLDRKLSEKDAAFQRLQLDHDAAARLNIRLQFVVGYTRTITKTKEFEFYVDVSAGVQHQNYRNKPSTETDGVFPIAVRFVWKITDQLTWEQRLSFEPRTSGEYRFVADGAFVTPIGKNLSLRLGILDEYESDPGPNTDNNDLTVALTIVYTF